MNLYGPKVSIVVPTFNEVGNIELLLSRLHDTLSPVCDTYEIIIIDDFSDDGTYEKLQRLEGIYPLKVMLKEGERGKAFSLLQGFKAARYPIIGFIDADLQYSPEIFSEMIMPLWNGEIDIMVANRKYTGDQIIRRFFSFAFRTIFARFLHGFNIDVQSGLKIFRKEIIERIDVRPSQWTFDLEFLLKARMAGYRISGIPMNFAPRHSGKSKVKTIQAIWEIGLSSLKLRFTAHEPIPFTSERTRKVGHGFHFRGLEYMHFTPLSMKDSAFTNFSKTQTATFFILGSILTGETFFNWHATLISIIAVITVLYFSDLVFYFYLITRSLRRSGDLVISDNELQEVRKDWPTYTILCPLYKEWKVLPQFIDGMNSLDYPKHKLQVMLLLEEDDNETINAVRNLALPSYFDTVLVPNTRPKTKPKACNFGLNLSKGTYSVIYDAEDIPDPQQLKKAVLAFEKAGNDVVCVQAKLTFYNPHQNLLTRIFSAEYALWFYLILTGLQHIDAPIPLGGTSNHFKTTLLRSIKGWDSFNVAEDCDIGVRLAKLGHRTVLLNSNTYEEANSEIKNWIWQRSRWIKGYIQTYLVHMRNPNLFTKYGKHYQLMYFQFVVGGKILLVLTNPIMWTITILYFMQRTTLGPFIESLFPAPVFYMGVLSFVFGNFMYAYYYVIACLHKRQYELIKYTIFVPFYWLLMSIAGWIAFIQFLYKPHFWAKTKHGFHIQNQQPNIAYSSN